MPRRKRSKSESDVAADFANKNKHFGYHYERRLGPNSTQATTTDESADLGEDPAPNVDFAEGSGSGTRAGRQLTATSEGRRDEQRTEGGDANVNDVNSASEQEGLRR